MSARDARASGSSASDIVRLVEQWRIEDAEAAGAQLIAEHPDDPESHYVDATLRFHRGDYAGASEKVHLALSHANRAERSTWGGVGELIDDTLAATRGFLEATSPEGHFIIRYAPGRDELLLPYAFEALESARREIGQADFQAGARLGDPTRVEIYPEISDLAKVSTLTEKEIETSGTIAICKFNRLMIVSPRALVHGYPWLDTLAHEYTHYIVSRVSRNTVPIWLHEGLAKFEERRWRVPSVANANANSDSRSASSAAAFSSVDTGLTPTMESLLATALGHGRRLITFDEMYPSMAKLPSQEDSALAFAEVFTVVEYLHMKKGWEGVRQVIERMKDGNGDARAVADVLGVSFEDFQHDWKGWLRGRKLKTHPGLVPTALKFAVEKRDPKRRGDGGHATPGPGPSDDRDDDETKDVAEEHAKKFVRLGGMLRARGRLLAAAGEYEKAQALVGAGHSVIGPRLARTYLSLGEADKAIAAAEPAFELYPESGAPAALLGEAWWKKQDATRAARYLRAAIRINPFDPTPHCLLAEILAGQGAAGAPVAAGAPAASGNSGDGGVEALRERNACGALRGGGE